MMIDNMMGLNIYQDGYTKEVQGLDSVAALVAVKAKPNRNADSPLDREFFNNFLEVFVSQVLV
jgi:hypothetical protein